MVLDGIVGAGGRVVRSLFAYRGDPDGAFARRPALQRQETFTAKDVKGIGQRIRLEGDLLGRGIRDAVSVETDGSLAARHITPRVLFMDASDEMLVRRYENNRRSHPLQGNQTLAEGIAAERARELMK